MVKSFFFEDVEQSNPLFRERSSNPIRVNLSRCDVSYSHGKSIITPGLYHANPIFSFHNCRTNNILHHEESKESHEDNKEQFIFFQLNQISVSSRKETLGNVVSRENKTS